MKYLGDTEKDSPSPVIEVGKKYWVRSKVTNEIQLCKCNNPIYINSKHGILFIALSIESECFDIFGPVTDETTPPDFDTLKKVKE